MKVLNVDVIFGQNELTNPTSFINQIDNVEISNGIFQHFNVFNSYNPNASDEQPTDWQSDFVMNIDFDNGLNAGNIEGIISNVNRIMVKRRKVGQYSDISEGWTTVGYISINSIDDLQFTMYDYLTACNTTYEYTLVPTLVETQGGMNVEIESSITNNSVILSETARFDSVFICDVNNYEKLNAHVNYGEAIYNQVTGIHQTISSKYPIIITNSAVDYISGNIDGMILNKGYGSVDNVTGEMVTLNRNAIVEATKEFKDFIIKKEPKIIKDWNGNIWLVMITDSPTYSFVNEWGMGLGTISFNWNEIGDINNENDLKNANMIYKG